jgi:hypothetical protein
MLQSATIFIEVLPGVIKNKAATQTPAIAGKNNSALHTVLYSNICGVQKSKRPATSLVDKACILGAEIINKQPMKLIGSAAI